jgi:hypothetical protein
MIDTVVIQPGTETGEPSIAGVSWAAVAAGAIVTCALTFVLLAFGVGLGLSVVSPWAGAGVSATTFKIGTGLYLVVIAMMSSSIGGYIAGRLRTRWIGVHSDEVYFRDTAHGFLVWAVGLVITAAFLASAAGSIMGTAAKAGGAAVAAVGAGAGATAVAQNQGGDTGTGYFVDSLYRSDAANSGASAAGSVNTGTLIPGTTSSSTSTPTAADTSATGSGMSVPFQRGADMNTRGETQRILINGLRQDQFPAADRAYLAQQVAARTGLSQADALRRVDAVLAQAQQVKTEALTAADNARHAASALAFWTFLSLLVGAFCASYAATIGGRQRDRVLRPTVRNPAI